MRELTSAGVTERLFDLTVAGERVPGVLWVPQGVVGPRPLVLMGHGGSQHKRIGFLASHARQWVAAHGWAVAAIDAPGHGDRVSRGEAMDLGRRIARRIAAGTPMDPEMKAEMAMRIAKGGPEWRATLDALRAMDDVGIGKVGYFGLSMGTAIGVPFVASEPRVTAAIFGLNGLGAGMGGLQSAAMRITCPIEFVFQWEDEIMPRADGVALFNAFASAEKSMHINPGGHVAIPGFESASWERFFLRHLGLGH